MNGNANQSLMGEATISVDKQRIFCDESVLVLNLCHEEIMVCVFFHAKILRKQRRNNQLASLCNFLLSVKLINNLRYFLFTKICIEHRNTSCSECCKTFKCFA